MSEDFEVVLVPDLSMCMLPGDRKGFTARHWQDDHELDGDVDPSEEVFAAARAQLAPGCNGMAATQVAKGWKYVTRNSE